MTQWTITQDKNADPKAEPGTNANAVGMVGPSGATMTSGEIQTSPLAEKFRLLDDDGEVYYVGYMVGTDNEFAPLDDFGTPNAGCTELQYFEDGSWKSL